STIDIAQRADRPEHARISYLHGSSVAPEIVAAVKSRSARAARVLVILDSDHSKEHVLAELSSYSALVTMGSYLIVEDTNIGGHPVLQTFGAGPMAAVAEFLRDRADFTIDREREKFFLTFNPKGYLRKVQ